MLRKVRSGLVLEAGIEHPGKPDGRHTHTIWRRRQSQVFSPSAACTRMNDFAVPSLQRPLTLLPTPARPSADHAIEHRKPVGSRGPSDPLEEEASVRITALSGCQRMRVSETALILLRKISCDPSLQSLRDDAVLLRTRKQMGEPDFRRHIYVKRRPLGLE